MVTKKTNRKTLISLRLSPMLLRRLKTRARALDVPYQRLIHHILEKGV